MSPPVSQLRVIATDPIPAVTGRPAPRNKVRQPRHDREPLGQILLDMKAVEPGNMLKAIALRTREDVRLGEILLAHGWVSTSDLMAGLSRQWSAATVDVLAEAPDARLLDHLGGAFCLREGILPLRRVGGAAILVTARPADFADLRSRLPANFGPVLMALAPERDIHKALINSRETSLIRRAENQSPADQSCRTQNTRCLTAIAFMVLAGLFASLILFPRLLFWALSLWAITTLVLFTGLKLGAFISEVWASRTDPVSAGPLPTMLPVVSVMVPLYRETDVVPRLIERLGRVSYPRELFDLLLVVEDADQQTKNALAGSDLPNWMRVITVPPGPIQTKPRALNYALDFCRGSIIGVWDAEDAPAADQIHKVVRQFHNSAPEVVCLQGILDYYNARHNWLSRCFTIEYAALFRVILPGLARLGFVLPLGGTTIFFRRAALETLGRWDAHNVTEDADLGLRLARAGYRTDMIDTVTEEEPNCHALPWIRQRSRWLKGFAMTWASHSRNPARLWRDLGAKRFFGIQIFLVGTLSQFLLAPVLWSFWLLLFDLPHPLRSGAASWGITALSMLFVIAELINFAIGLWALRACSHRHLMKWVPGMPLYFTLAAFAAYKAVHEWVAKPFYWDKTAHGILEPDTTSRLPVLHLTNPVGFCLPKGAMVRQPQPSAATPPRLQLVVTSPPPQPACPGQSAHMILLAESKAHRALGSTIANPSHRPSIEFQPCFEGFGDM
ncbi:MAG: glycosyltransferase [Paracoccaceae bacterium]|nr:glycosyltransferase [Paracoccaceae bacterium]